MSRVPRSMLITGANRGLGLELVKQIVRLSSPPENLFATCRDPDNAVHLQDIARKHACVKVMKLDVNDFNSYNALKEKIASMLEGHGLNLLLCNAGIHIRADFSKTDAPAMMNTYSTNVVGPLLLSQKTHGGQTGKFLSYDVTNEEEIQTLCEDTRRILGVEGLNLLINNAGISYKKQYLGNLSKKNLVEQFDVNLFSPLLINQAFLPLLKLAAQKSDQTGMSWSKAAIINISSILSSVQMNSTGGLYPYRASKAALNMITKNQSIDLKSDQILAVAIHPGWVQTDMGGKAADITPEQSVEGMLNVFSSLQEESNGRLFDFTGKNLPW